MSNERKQSTCLDPATHPSSLATRDWYLGDTLLRSEREAHSGASDTSRYRCPYFSLGAGPPIVFIPGLADNSRSFILPASLLAEQFRCIAYDLPAGRVDGARLRRYRHDDLVADLFALIDHLNLPHCY